MSRLSPRSATLPVTVALWVLFTCLVTTLHVYADVVTLKTGEQIEGKIISEATDMVRIEVQVSSSIKETKTFSMADVAKIEKTAADKVAFTKLKANHPSPDLLSSADYENLIRASAKRFLTTYPESEHVAEVEAIIKQWEEEKEKVQLGAIKLDGEWISREDRQLYRFAIEARIRLKRMAEKVANKDILGSLREFETIDERYQETPAHAAALGNAVKLLPPWIQNLERQLSNVEFLNKRDQDAAKLLKADELAQIQQAKAAEKARFEQMLANEKSRGILWTSINPRSSESLQNGIALANAQLKRLREIDPVAVENMGKALTEANRLIGEEKFTAARGKIAEATGSSAKKRSRRSNSTNTTEATRYSQWLLGQISAKEQALEDAATEAVARIADAKESSTASTVSEEGEEGATEGDPDMADKAEGEEGEKQAAKPQTRAEIIAAERARNEARKAAEGSDKDDDKSSKPKPAANKKDADDEDGQESDTAAASSGGGFNPKFIVWGVAGLLIVTVVILKVMGIGGTKDGGGGGE